MQQIFWLELFTARVGRINIKSHQISAKKGFYGSYKQKTTEGGKLTSPVIGLNSCICCKMCQCLPPTLIKLIKSKTHFKLWTVIHLLKSSNFTPVWRFYFWQNNWSKIAVALKLLLSHSELATKISRGFHWF